MRALTVKPGTTGSARVENIAEPAPEEGSVLVETHAVGVCGTDVEIMRGLYGRAPPGRERLVLGHESIGRVLEAPDGAGLAAGDWVVAIVRRPDPVPCPNCAAGEWDMCRNGRYTEHGIKALDGFARERYRAPPDALVRIDGQLAELGVLVEPASVVAKAWEHTERILARSAAVGVERVLITGAGPIGLLAALMGRQRGHEVHVLDRITDGPKPELVRALGATYHSKSVHAVGEQWDVIFECTGAASVFFDVIEAAAPNGVVCLTGVSSGGACVSVDAGALNRELVLENNVVFGSVNANRRHYEQGARALAEAERQWLARLLTRRVPIDDFAAAFSRQPNDVKTTLSFAHG